MRLYHFTSSFHWPDIKASGVIRVTESNVSLTRPHVGPDVVWLTDDPEPRVQRWGIPTERRAMTVWDLYHTASIAVPRGTTEPEAIIALERAGQVPAKVIEDLKSTGKTILGTVNKTDLRFTVEIPDAEAHRYSDWRKRQGVRNAIYRALRDSGGDPERWWVVERPIPGSEWIEVVEIATDALMDWTLD